MNATSATPLGCVQTEMKGKAVVGPERDRTADLVMAKDALARRAGAPGTQKGRRVAPTPLPGRDTVWRQKPMLERSMVVMEGSLP